MKFFYSLSLQGNREDHAVETVGFEAQQRIPASRDNIVSMESVDTYEAGWATSLCFQVAGFIKKPVGQSVSTKSAEISRWNQHFVGSLNSLSVQNDSFENKVSGAT